MIFIVFLVVLVVTYVMVDSTVRPLKNIAAAARNFTTATSAAGGRAQAAG